jgi:nicotinamidase-related amidase
MSLRTIVGTSALAALLALAPLAARPATVIDDWSTIATPAAPALQSVQVDPATTALLVLDFVGKICSGPRCQAAVPGVAALLQAARANHVPVVYSFAFGTTMADTLPAVAPIGTEPAVQSGPDKFIGTDLQQILTSRGIKTVIVTGMTAQGAVLYTASHAALAGFKVVVPVDLAPAEVPFGQLVTVWQLANAPRVSAAVTLTRSDKITF